MKYKTIEAHSVERLDTLINEKLSEGWDLYGDLIVKQEGWDNAFYQGMILMVEGDF